MGHVSTHRIAIWDSFCAEHQILSKATPLFSCTSLAVETFAYGKNKRTLLKRSPEMESLVISEVSKVLRDFELGDGRYEGLIYLMFWESQGRVMPLYIGKSEKYGRKGRNLSANIEQIEKNTGKFCRWGYNYAYHMGDLSAVVCMNHPDSKKRLKYMQWADRLFTNAPSSRPMLRQPVYFWIEAWERDSIGLWKEYGSMSLTFLEYLLIGVASDLFPEILLNREGVNRQECVVLMKPRPTY